MHRVSGRQACRRNYEARGGYVRRGTSNGGPVAMTNVGVNARSTAYGSRSLSGEGARRASVTSPMTAAQAASEVMAIAGMKMAHSSTATIKNAAGRSRRTLVRKLIGVTRSAYKRP